MEDIQAERLKNFLDAEKKALISQEYQEGSFRNRRANLNQISAGINELMASGAGQQSGGRSKRVVFRD